MAALSVERYLTSNNLLVEFHQVCTCLLSLFCQAGQTGFAFVYFLQIPVSYLCCLIFCVFHRLAVYQIFISWQQLTMYVFHLMCEQPTRETVQKKELTTQDVDMKFDITMTKHKGQVLYCTTKLKEFVVLIEFRAVFYFMYSAVLQIAAKQSQSRSNMNIFDSFTLPYDSPDKLHCWCDTLSSQTSPCNVN